MELSRELTPKQAKAAAIYQYLEGASERLDIDLTKSLIKGLGYAVPAKGEGEKFLDYNIRLSKMLRDMFTSRMQNFQGRLPEVKGVLMREENAPEPRPYRQIAKHLVGFGLGSGLLLGLLALGKGEEKG